MDAGCASAVRRGKRLIMEVILMTRLVPIACFCLLIAGCPAELPPEEQAPDQSARVIGASTIPEGIYFGEKTTIVETYLYNELIETITDTTTTFENIGADGLPLVEGEVIRPGLAFTNTDGQVVTALIGTVQASGTRVSVTYRGDIGIGPASSEFDGRTLYELTDPKTLVVTETFEWGSFADRSAVRQVVKVESVLRR